MSGDEGSGHYSEIADADAVTVSECMWKTTEKYEYDVWDEHGEEDAEMYWCAN